jgi:hypothetical protein
MTLDKKWEKFNGGPAASVRSAQETLRVTINQKGLIYMNARAFQALGRPKAVAIYYSREDDSIALEPAYPRFIQNFPVVQKQNGYVIHASSFCRHFRLKIPLTQRFIRPDVTHEGQMILNLRETVTVGGITRKRKAAAIAPNN